MDQKRAERANSLIQKLAANFIEREINPAGALTTVTRIEIAPSFKEVRIFVSVWPETKEGGIRDALLTAKKDFYEYMKKNFKIKYMPAFDFEIDKGEKARQRIEEILQKNK
ncbi:MAG: ribosome-binding factor A [Patescibacteria group bacterium]